MSGLEFVDRRDVGREAWDAFVCASPDAWLWHRYALADALGGWPGSADISFGVRAEGRLVAVVPLRRIEYRRLRLLHVCDVESLGGPALSEGIGRRLAERVRSEALAEAERRADGRLLEVRVALSPLSPALRGADAPRVNPLLQLGLQNTLTQTWIVDLRVDRDALWAGLEGRTRTAIRKAEREGIAIRPATTDRADLLAYEALHAETCARTGAQRHPRTYFEAIWRDFLPEGLARVFFAMKEGHVIAARNFGVFKGGALAWTAAGTTEAGPLGANALLQWEAMCRLADEGIEWSETGEAFPGTADPKQQGLSGFKQSFGGELRPFYRGRLDLRPALLRRLDALRS